ncbi:MAG TPA: hypothetical protein VJS15_10065, partial [Allosphingosinicella sp.]|nr:hypothetical protein [Allosphingosinicella sp.]
MLAIAGTAAARVIVVASTGPAARAYPMGKSLPDDVAIRLRQRESVTILGRAGTRVFRGPGTFRPSDPVRAGPRPGAGARGPHGVRLGGIMMSTIERRPRIGAVMGAIGGVPSRP